MYPTLDFIFLQVASYSFFTIAALVVALAGSYRFALKRGFKKADVLIMLLGLGLSVFIGARLFNIAVNFDWYMKDPSRAFALTATGFSLYGGILLALIAGLLISHFRRIPLFKFADTVTPFIGIGIVLMRIGCFLNGCCFGKETDLPWGVTFPPMSPAHLYQISENLMGSTSVHAVHPTQIYELIAALIGTIIAFVLIKRGKPDGTAFLVCGMYFSAFRWLNMQFRVLSYSDAMINVWYPLLYTAIIVLCGFLLIRIIRKAN